ncbi:MAG: triosephosphate isomerase [Chlorobi bacterium]|nr:triosephosphate isomerase [Chlorobiota bacterium]
MRNTIIAGNWKMNTNRSSSIALADAIVDGLRAEHLGDNLDIVLCPPFVFIPLVGERIRGGRIRLGAQTMNNEPSGAFTGEVSGEMLRSVDCAYVIVGHSERRTMFAESDLDVCYRVNAAQEVGLSPIICVGETIVEREKGLMREVVERQVRTALDGILEFAARTCAIAYEPIWAIGTGENATPEQIEEAHGFIREIIGQIYTPEVAEDIPILYGGSMNAGNAASILARPGVDGGLIGGASLDAASFVSIVRAAASR